MNDKILNLTQHPATAEQVAAGVVEPSPELKKEIQTLITFEEIPTCSEMHRRAKRLVEIAKDGGYPMVMIGGAPFFMHILVGRMNFYGILTLFAFSKRQVVEKTNADGSVEKVSVFKHEGFVAL